MTQFMASFFEIQNEISSFFSSALKIFCHRKRQRDSFDFHNEYYINKKKFHPSNYNTQYKSAEMENTLMSNFKKKKTFQHVNSIKRNKSKTSFIENESKISDDFKQEKLFFEENQSDDIRNDIMYSNQKPDPNIQTKDQESEELIDLTEESQEDKSEEIRQINNNPIEVKPSVNIIPKIKKISIVSTPNKENVNDDEIIEPSTSKNLNFAIKTKIIKYDEIQESSYDSSSQSNDISIRNQIVNQKSLDFTNYNDLCKYQSDKNDAINYPFIPQELFDIFMKINEDQDYEQRESALVENSSLRKLSQGSWLNDEIINAYVSLINKRTSLKPNKINVTHYFNTYFLEGVKNEVKNKAYNFEKYRKQFQKKKVNLLSFKNVVIPINIRNAHWSVAVVNPTAKSVVYYDSCINFTGENSKEMAHLISNFFDDVINCEAKLKKGEKHDETVNTTKDKSNLDENFSSSSNPDENSNELGSKWKYYFPDCPQQENNYDCGVYMLKFIDYISRNKEYDFGQSDMDYFRIEIACSLISGQILTSYPN